MNNLQTQAITKARELKEQLGGTIFAFPIEGNNPFSAYAIVMYAEGTYFPYPNAANISEASLGVLTLLEELKKIGQDADYERNVRLVSYQTQMDAPSTVMKRLKKKNAKRPLLEEVKDISKGSEETGHIIYARGLLKLSYFMMVDEKNPKASQFMTEYYKLLAMRKYGKTAAAIKQEVRKMSKDQVSRWLEETFDKYIHDDLEIMNIFHGLGAS